ncbi:MAG: hypothetical protein AB7K04_02025 [Pseudorhodoplanes sp.]
MTRLWEAFSSEVGTGSREENATSERKRFQAKWAPVRVKKMRRVKEAFSSEVSIGSREENATSENQKASIDMKKPRACPGAFSCGAEGDQPTMRWSLSFLSLPLVRPLRAASSALHVLPQR